MWKYSNPGNYQLLDSHNGRTYANIEDSTKAPKTGLAYTTLSKEDTPIAIPDGTTEVWVKMDVFVKDKATVMLRSRTTAYAVIAVLEETGWSITSSYRGYDFTNQRFTVLEDNKEGLLDLDGKVATLELRVRSKKLNESSILNGADGYVEMRINHKIMAIVENVAIFNGEDIKLDSITSTYGYSYFSNIIVSDEEIQGRENVCVLPISEITLDGWTQVQSDGTLVEYKADGVNQSITQSFNVNAVREAIGEDAVITSLNIRTIDVSTDNPNEVDSLSTKLLINGVEKYNKIDSINGKPISSEILNNPDNDQPWTLDDLETTELIVSTNKSES